MSYLYRVENKLEEVTRSAQIELVEEYFEVHFYENTSYVGTIEYLDKSYGYVMDAATNWVNWIMTKETIDRYKR
jgi:hypothetical protein